MDGVSLPDEVLCDRIYQLTDGGQNAIDGHRAVEQEAR